ncbi:MAG: Ig-like domain-containing protein [Cyclobacteriaceae bacterium]|nr:Ig-like domain-containing protein [Cyclobacteriaceae bacterium]
MVKRLYFLILLILVLSLSAWAQPEPTNHATGFSVTATSSTAITVAWTGATGATLPEFYLIVGRELPGGTFVTVADGPEIPADADWTDGNFAAIVSHSAGANSLPVTGLDPETEYEFSIYSYQRSGGSGGNSNYKTGGQPTASDFTFSVEPGGHSATFTATLNGNTTIDLEFEDANTLSNAVGYVLYRNAGSAVNLSGLNDGAAPPNPLNGATLVTTTNASATSYSDAGLQGGVTYHYALVPFNYNGSNAGTYNFLNNGAAPTASAITTLVVTLNQISGPGSNIAANPLNSASTNQAILGFSITTNGPTTFNALTVSLTSTATGKFLNPRIFKSADTSFGGDASINTGTIGTQLQFTGINDVLSGAGTTNYFVVVNVESTVSAVTPSIQPSFTQANITFTSPPVTPGALTITGTDYSFVDATPPAVVSTTPSDNATGVSVLLNQFSITFSEPVVLTSDYDVSDATKRIVLYNDDANNIVETIAEANINIAGNVVTFTISASLEDNTNYDIIIGNQVFEDLIGNVFTGIPQNSWDFDTELAPSLSPTGAVTRCIGDVQTITGARFTGTGGTGNTQPFVFIDGVQVPPGNISAYTSGSVTFTVPTNAPIGTGPITVQNQDNFLMSSNSRSITVHPQIDTGLPVIPATLTPAQNTSVNIQIQNTQSSNYTYSLIANSTPGGYTATTQTTTGNNGNRTLTTTPALSVIGDYTYRIDVSRTGCTTRTLSNTPFTLTIAPLSVTVSATETSVCIGSSTTLIGSVSGGTGFYQFRWTSDPAGYSSNNSSPTVSPTTDIRYILEVEDNSGNTATGFVDITINPITTASFEPAPGETVVRTNYTIENRNYQLYGLPVGGTFSGQGVSLLSDGNYYFNPQNAGVGEWDIVYSFTNAFGCTDQATEQFKVALNAIVGLDPSYCRNVITDGPLTHSIAAFPPSGWQFTRIVFYRYDHTTFNYCITEAAPVFPFCGTPNPLTVTSVQTVTDIQTGLPVVRPVSYSINLNVIRTNYGSSTTNDFYLLVYGKNSSGVETYLTFQAFRLLDNDPAPSIIGINENENICVESAPVPLSISEPGYSVTNFTITPGIHSGALSGLNNSEFNPGHSSFLGVIESEKPLTINMAYNDFNGCPSSVSRNFNWIGKPSTPLVSNSEYCQVPVGGTVPPLIINAIKNGDATNAKWYDRDPVANPTTHILLDDINFTFIPPGITGLTPTIQIFYVSQVNKGCEGNAIPASIEIKPAPNAIFSVPTVCEDQEFSLIGPTDSGVPYAQYHWVTSTKDTIIHNHNIVTHNYGPNTGNIQYTIGLTVTSDRNCINTFNTNVVVGINPFADFTAELICRGDSTRLNATVPNIQVDQFEWDFGDSSPIIGPGNLDGDEPGGGTFQSPKHLFLGSAETYDVTVTAYTGIGCNSSKTKTIRILDSLNVATSYRMGDWDNGQGYWRLEDVAGNSTWEFGQPATPLFSQFGTDAWVTNADNVYLENEKSYVNSPCINFSSINRPSISIDYLVNTRDRVDGAVLEYSNDSGLTWESLGSLNTGLDWFNTTGFLLGNIGSSPVGWSGDTDLSIKTGRHTLDIVTNKAKARFRIAFSSGPDGTNPIAVGAFEGFAFRNIVIESRNRNLLIENFTQESFGTNNNTFTNIPSTEGTKLQYHIGFPGTDNIYLENTADPGARAAFYGITNSTGLVPRAYIDGYSNGSFTGSWNSLYRGLRSLAPSPVEIDITTLPQTISEELQFEVSITPATPTSEIPTGKPVLHAVIIEREVETDNYFVVRKMLPNAAGRPLAVPVNAPLTESYTWKPESPNFSRSQIAIVAFIQDEVTKEVYQAAELLNPDISHIPDPSIITSIEDPSFAGKIQVYPNPANREVNVVLPERTLTSIAVTLADAHGRTVHTNGFAAGEQQKTIDTSELAAGLYILQLSTPQGVVRKKVMVVHEK